MHKRTLSSAIAVALLVWPAFLFAETPAKEASECLASSLGELRIVNNVPICRETLEACSDACGAGDAKSCLGAAYATQQLPDAKAKANSLFRQACRLGLANACTNFAASIWAAEAKDADLACAHDIFRKACTAKEHFACGMMGRLAFDRAKTPAEFAAGRSGLEKACENVGGFSCRVLAKQLETGNLGEYAPAQISKLLERACGTGDPSACGQPKAAAETFN